MTTVLDQAAQQTHYADAQRDVRQNVRKMYIAAKAAINGFAEIEERVTTGDLPLMADQHQQMTTLLSGSEAALIQSMQATNAIIEQMELAIQERGHTLFGISVTPSHPDPPEAPPFEESLS